MIDELWREFGERPFPDRIPRLARERLDLELLDSDTAGCIQTYLALGTLSSEETGILRACRGELRALSPDIGREAAEYFGRLERLAALVLDQLDRTRPHGLP